jgi:hypothetical protein
MYTILSRDMSDSEAEQVLALIPWRWRQAWQMAVSDFNENVQRLWNLKSRIRDVTIEKRTFIDDVHSGKLKLWRKAIREVPIETVL